MGVIVVGYVPKPEGKAALRLAAEEAKSRGSSLVVVNSHRGGREFDNGDAVESETQLEEVRAQLKDRASSTRSASSSGDWDPAEDLINVAGEVSADFIVIGLRRRSPVGKLILGSNAQRILLDAPCPVLAVKAAE